MEISYDTIISFLCEKNFVFNSKPKLSKKIDNFDIFKDSYRLGIEQYNDMNINISLIASILYLLNDDYIMMELNDKYSTINNMLEQIKDYWNKLDNYNIPQIDGNADILLYSSGKLVNFTNLYYILCKCLNINLMILDYESKKISIYSRYIDKIDVNYPLLILANYKYFYEPVYKDNIKLFNLKDPQFALLLKDYSIKDYIPKKNILNKMKKKELCELCDKLNIKYISKDTRSILISKILN